MFVNPFPRILTVAPVPALVGAKAVIWKVGFTDTVIVKLAPIQLLASGLIK